MKKKLIHGISHDREMVHKIWLTMRLIVFLFFVSLLHVSASVYSQKTKLNLKVDNVTLQQVFKAIQDQSEFDFFYKNEQIPSDTRVSIEFKNEAVEVILNNVLQGTGLGYHVLDKDIVISTNVISKNETGQQQKSVTGKVTDQTGASVPGASVIIKGTTTGVVTDNNGNYSLVNIPENAVLQFSFVGMKTQEFAVGNKTTINAVLAEETIGIEEVVAVGYGTMKKTDLTGSVSSVNSGKLTQRAITSMEQGLQGRMAGVQVTQPSGAPGASAIVRVRGTNSIQYGNDPLYVVDGFPLANGISFINPNDIETMTVLKDASATAIYGSRGANGVILVTTKKGTSGKTIVSFESYYGIQDVTKKSRIVKCKRMGNCSTHILAAFPGWCSA